jgi:hypothetical protein
MNRAKIKQEERLDGKYLIATSDPYISAEDTALGYKNLLEAERESATSNRRTCGTLVVFRS